MTTVFCVHGGRVVNCSGVLGYVAGDGVHRVVNGDMGGGRTAVTVQDIFYGVFFFRVVAGVNSGMGGGAVVDSGGGDDGEVCGGDCLGGYERSDTFIFCHLGS